METFASLQKPVAVSWTGDGFIASYRDDVTRLVSIGVDGKVQPFAPSFSGKEEVYIAISQGRAGFSQGYLFLCSGDSIYRMEPSGTTVNLFSTPSQGSTVEYIAFDTDGVWGYLLYGLTANGGLWAINATGGAELVANLGDNLMPEGIAFAPASFGAYSGDMLVSREKAHDLVAISPTNPAGVIPLAQFPGEAPERVLIIPANSDLFIAEYDQGIIVKMGAGNLSNYVGLPLVITEGEAGQVGSFTVLKPLGTNVTTIRILSDPSSPHFEGAAFVPAGSTSGGVATNPSATSATGAELPVAAVIIVAIATLASALIVKRRRRRTG